MYNGFQAESNNPFLSDAQTAPAHSRFPNISASTFQQSPPQMGYQSYDTGYQQQPYFQQQQYPQFQGQTPYNQPQQYQQNQYASSSYRSGQLAPQSTGMPFQPPSQFGQQLASQADFQQPYQQYPNGYQNQYVQQQQQQQLQQQQQYGGYQPQQQLPSYLSEFDPYRDAPHPTPSRNRSSSQPTSLASHNPGGAMHPRDYIRQHKSELEAWDPYTWKQMFNACDALSAAWLTRKQEAERAVQQLGGNSAPGFFGPTPGYQAYGNELQRWQELVKEANSYHDTVAASAFQLKEVHSSYRQSGDAVSKRRVRESCNAALSNLPDWPAPLNATQPW
ncbi:uncharacterized protein EDB93DRAFT_491322 [Suillus bovinus]|uniref:uncharacterized protein n=1 Tax=Suillus bovinus TaxID=48563 RepID=UPI001B8645A9|nr:uncharacterized protein EDB93DRAFT_491322 [Suillus bovinus]KAG2146191.1 hypothetical protein EDB93DRAFT_491322 [Suillus bovinus]